MDSAKTNSELVSSNKSTNNLPEGEPTDHIVTNKDKKSSENVVHSNKNESPISLNKTPKADSIANNQSEATKEDKNLVQKLKSFFRF